MAVGDSTSMLSVSQPQSFPIVMLIKPVMSRHAVLPRHMLMLWSAATYKLTNAQIRCHMQQHLVDEFVGGIMVLDEAYCGSSLSHAFHIANSY